MIWNIIALAGLIMLTAAVNFADSATVSINDSKLEKLASAGDKRAVRLKKLTDRPNHFTGTMKAAAIFSGMLSASYAAYFISPEAAAKLSGKTGESLANTIILLVTALLAMLITLAFGVIFPKKAAGRDPEKYALRFSRFIKLVCIIFTPGVWLANAVAGVLLRLIGVDPHAKNDAVTEEEILMMSDAGAENGTIDEDENRIIKNVFAFDDMTADQICTHRTDVSVLWSSDDISVWEETIHRTRHSVFPICGESVDNVIGVLHAKDFFRLDNKSRENVMANAVREPYFVHEAMKADRLFEHMKQNGADHFAVVVDEYGGMSGIITVTDLVEQLVGDFSDDEYGEPSAKIEQLDQNCWESPGIAPLSDVNDELETDLPSDNYDTFGGYIIASLGDLPKDGSKLSLDCDGLHVDVLEVNHHRIELCRVRKLSPPPENSNSTV